MIQRPQKSPYRPINVVLNCKFLEGKFQQWHLDEKNQNIKYDYLQVYLSPFDYTDIGSVRDREVICVRKDNLSSGINNRIEVNEKDRYMQRKLSEKDGLLYFYQKNNGRITEQEIK